MKRANKKVKQDVQVPETNSKVDAEAAAEIERCRDTDAFCEWIASFDQFGYSEEGGPRSPFVSKGAAEHFVGQIRKYLDLTGYIGRLPSGPVSQISPEGSGQ